MQRPKQQYFENSNSALKRNREVIEGFLKTSKLALLQFSKLRVIGNESLKEVFIISSVMQLPVF